MSYRPGFLCISQDFGISSTFDVSARILTYQSGFCTTFHCSTQAGVFSSGTWESPSVSSLNPPQTRPFSPSTTRAVTPVEVGHRPLYARQDSRHAMQVYIHREKNMLIEVSFHILHIRPYLHPTHVQGEKSFDVSVFYVWRIAQEFGVSARILAYQVRLTYQPGI